MLQEKYSEEFTVYEIMLILIIAKLVVKLVWKVKYSIRLIHKWANEYGEDERHHHFINSVNRDYENRDFKKLQRKAIELEDENITLRKTIAIISKKQGKL